MGIEPNGAVEQATKSGWSASGVAKWEKRNPLLQEIRLWDSPVLRGSPDSGWAGADLPGSRTLSFLPGRGICAGGALCFL